MEAGDKKRKLEFRVADEEVDDDDVDYPMNQSASNKEYMRQIVMQENNTDPEWISRAQEPGVEEVVDVNVLTEQWASKLRFLRKTLDPAFRGTLLDPEASDIPMVGAEWQNPDPDVRKAVNVLARIIKSDAQFYHMWSQHIPSSYCLVWNLLIIYGHHDLLCEMLLWVHKNCSIGPDEMSRCDSDLPWHKQRRTVVLEDFLEAALNLLVCQWNSETPEYRERLQTVAFRALQTKDFTRNFVYEMIISILLATKTTTPDEQATQTALWNQFDAILNKKWPPNAMEQVHLCSTVALSENLELIDIVFEKYDPNGFGVTIDTLHTNLLTSLIRCQQLSDPVPAHIVQHILKHPKVNLKKEYEILISEGDKKATPISVLNYNKFYYGIPKDFLYYLV